MAVGITSAAYLAAGVLFILSLGGLSRPETARRGNVYGMAGMAIAILATLSMDRVTSYGAIVAAMAVGGVIGIVIAKRVVMTDMPQLVAMLHSFVGLAAVLVGFASYLDDTVRLTGVERTIHEVEIYLGVLIGAVTFTGSIIAFGKLQGVVRSNPLILPARHWLNLGLLLVTIWLGWRFGQAPPGDGLLELSAMTVIAFLFGIHMVMAIGGADMPVVVSMLNSYSGWAAAATGFMLSNDLLIVTGALVGSSGAILSHIMCKAMNRHFLAVIAGGFGDAKGGTPVAIGEGQEVVPVTAEEAAQILKDADSVVIVPGYGMAVAQAQYPVYEITRKLREDGVNVRFRSEEHTSELQSPCN